MSKNIYVFIEQRDGKVQKVGYELIGESTRLAKDLGQKVVGVLLGHNITDKAEMIIKHGADEVVVVDNPILEEYSTEPYTKALSKVINDLEPEIVLFGATSIGRDLAPRIAGRVHTGLTADCTSLSIDEESKLLLMTRPAFGGNIMATIVCKKHRPQMATIRPGVMSTLDIDMDKEGEIKLFNVEFTDEDKNVEILEVVKENKKTTDITASKVLVSGGRGIGGPEGFNILREVASELGGEISSSRACVDAGWIESSRQVGQTGKTVRPNLYLACGISGAIQHVAGMEESDCIISINKNDTSAIFNASDLGVVGDLKVILPKLLNSIKEYKNKDKETVDSLV
ncbi:electron transfer flavoprotein subunit alpha/FixB family protein [Terrisporobacter glycolicus]|uniref:Caffeyl-CoA reductase-Etf complex subunit CarE n=1 Tax=Terrisporobacter glycolicus ATCC 14880 = DSM 1288 TaxID=1121315 RepID=A0ABZ2ERH2_9FIRM|nr:electron transfer flavoprotein subunit alpha/FixB family protein [Terrisporobacter glycolicus]